MKHITDKVLKIHNTILHEEEHFVEHMYAGMEMA